MRSKTAIKAGLFFSYFIFAILLNSVGTVILQLQTRYGISPTRAGALEGFKDLSIAIGSFFVGAGLMRLGYRRGMILGLALVGVACAAMPSLPGFAAAKALFAITGLSFALVKVAVFASLGVIAADEKDHAATMNFIEGVFMVGILAGYGLFGHFIGGGADRWLRVYYVLAALCAVAVGLLAATPIPEPESARQRHASFADGVRGMAALGGNRLVLLFVACAFLSVLIEQSIMSWLPTFNRTVLKLPVALSIEVAAILPATCALGRFGAAFLLRRVRWFRVLIGCLVAAATLVALALPLAEHAAGAAVTGWSSAPAAAFVFPLIGLFLAPIYPAINSAILTALPTHRHAPMSGLIVIFSALGGTTGSMINGRLFELYGGRTAFHLSLAPIAGLALCLLLFQRAQGRAIAPVRLS